MSYQDQLYSNVAARILSDLENGCAPWVKPWAATAGRNIPQNAVTGRPYSGANVVLLWMSHGLYSAPRYMTKLQCQKAGGRLKETERGNGTFIYFVKPVMPKEVKEGEEKRGYTVLKQFTVYNIDQCEGLPDTLLNPDPVKPRNNELRDATIDEFISSTGIEYRDGKGGDRAFYSPAGDFVAMPEFEAFDGAASYYATAFHELGHATGHKSRLDRDFKGRFGDQDYAAEELVAELTAAFLCAEWNLNGELRHAGYIGHWIKLLKDKPRAFFTAASAAQKAADYLRTAALASPVSIAA